MEESFWLNWNAVMRYAIEIQQSPFAAEMIARRDARGSQSLMGILDCGLLYGLTRWCRPEVIVESGGYVGMSSAFILKALQDAGLTNAKLYSIEWLPDCGQGSIVPDELRGGFVPLQGRVEHFMKRGRLPATIDMFLHDSSHRYRHMLLEFRHFWKCLRDRGLLVSHDVHFSAAFPKFLAATYRHDRNGQTDFMRTEHYEWGRWGYLGFAIKKDAAAPPGRHG